QVARRRARVEAGGLREEPAVRVAPQIAHHRKADHVEGELREIREDVLRDERQEEKDRHREADRNPRRLRRGPSRGVERVEPPDERPGARGSAAESRKRGRGARAEDVVDDLGQQEKEEDRRKRNDRHRAEGGERAAAVGPEVGEKAAERAHRPAELLRIGDSTTSRTASAARSLPPGGPSSPSTRASAARIFASRVASSRSAAPSRSSRAAWTCSCSSSGTTSSPATMLTREIQ